ncbi:DNA-binding transcriptional LysR family regulator [Chitinivorax tropicus]|uniref:DNA-binding transcriptional LysR family regulator n=1 Tax=Chitinivorax tropicus TaxID=714531 RepID=A0A840MKW0_9PROT|nr:LysR family transcriptional regulator [Chitinivorax tropicus]MBB5017196.1 DNA-binding transcriptional LysR family regulator [Chitinivorax tropicus]
MNDWDDWRVFLAVMEAGSFTKAAECLSLNQPTVGRRIEALENQLGEKLFQRHARGLRPTELADKLLPHVRLMADGATSASRVAASQGDCIQGVVTLSAAPAVANGWLARKLADFHCRHPKLEISLQGNSKVVDLNAGEADIAIRLFRPDEPQLVIRRLGVVANRFYAHPDYLASQGEPYTLGDLAGHDMVGFSDMLSSYEMVWLNQHIPANTRYVLKTNHAMTAMQFVSAGGGIALLPDYVATLNPALKVVCPETVIHLRDIWLVMHRDLAKTARIRALADFLIEAFDNDPLWQGKAANPTDGAAAG